MTGARCYVFRGTSQLLSTSQHELMQLYGPNIDASRKNLVCYYAKPRWGVLVRATARLGRKRPQTSLGLAQRLPKVAAIRGATLQLPSCRPKAEMPRYVLALVFAVGQSLVASVATPSRRPRTIIRAEPPNVPQDLPFDIQRRVDEAKRRQTERQTEDTQRKRLRKKEPVSYTHLTLPTICSV